MVSAAIRFMAKTAMTLSSVNRLITIRQAHQTFSLAMTAMIRFMAALATTGSSAATVRTSSMEALETMSSRAVPVRTS